MKMRKPVHVIEEVDTGPWTLSRLQGSQFRREGAMPFMQIVNACTGKGRCIRGRAVCRWQEPWGGGVVGVLSVLAPHGEGTAT